jgi:nucleoside-diphosphate-sugar epimerase
LSRELPNVSGLPPSNGHSTNSGKSLDFFVDVQDNARLHVAALIHPDVQGERIFAYASPFTWRGIQRIMQKLYPGKTFPRDLDEAELDKSDIVRAPRTEALLRDMGRPGWTSLEETVRLNIEDLA